MAVVLCRSDGKALGTPDQRSPRIVIESKPPPIDSHQGKKINARSETHYACAEPKREEVWKQAFQRREVHRTMCGFHGASNRPYHDVGGLVLDDRRLILEGLGLEQDKEDHSEAPAPENGGDHTYLPPSAGKLQLRARTAAQFPTELSNLDDQRKVVKKRVELVSRGHGLFKLVKDREIAKRAAMEQATKADTLTNEWREPSATNLHGDDVFPWQPTTNETPVGENMMVDDSIVDDHAQFVRGDGMEEEQPSHYHIDVVEVWFRQLGVLLWILEAMKMESPTHMPPLAQFWRINRPVPSEGEGRRRVDMTRKQLQYWDTVIRQQKKPALRRMITVNPVRLSQTSRLGVPKNRSLTPQGATPTGDHMTSHDLMQSTSPLRQSGDQLPQRRKTPILHSSEEERMKQQRKLTPNQMKNLLTTLEEELNFSKRQSRTRIKALMRETDQAKLPQGLPFHLPPISLDVDEMTRKFSDAEERRKMIVHEQLSAMERDGSKALQQRFSSLQVSGNLWQDLAVMREGVEIESTAMARRKLLMNYEWYSDLFSLVPVEVKQNRYCHQLLVSLKDLAHYTYSVGPSKMSKRKLIQVLGSLRPWELKTPEIAFAVEFVITKVIYVVTEDYEQWLEQHAATFHSKTTSYK